MQRGIPQLMKEGTEHLSGLEQAILRNIEACKQLGDLTRTSLGPNGMNKIVINHIGKMFITSDCATIMKEMEIVHPAAKMIVLAATMQEQEVGDGSNFVVCLAGELLSRAEGLLKLGLHPSELIAGYKAAGELAVKELENLAVVTATDADMFDHAFLKKAVMAAVGAKQHNDSDFIAGLVADACLCIMPKNRNNFSIDNVRVCKVAGASLLQSEVIKGMVINRGVETNVVRCENAKVAVFTCGLEPTETETKGNVLLKSAEELVNYSSGEEESLHKHIKAIADSGVTMIITGGAVDDMAKHFIAKYGMMVVRVASKFEIRRLCEATKARPLVSMGPVAPEFMGFCSLVYVREVGSAKVTVFQQDSGDDTGIATVMLRGATSNMLQAIERAVDDGVNTIKALGKDGRLLAGAGACDIEVSRKLDDFGDKETGLSQYAIKQYARALEIVPRVLAENAGHNANESIASLIAEHEKGNTSTGIDITVAGIKGGTIDAHKAQLFDLLATRKSALKLATNAVVTILRVDCIIQCKRAGGPKLPKNGQGGWDN